MHQVIYMYIFPYHEKIYSFFINQANLCLKTDARCKSVMSCSKPVEDYPLRPTVTPKAARQRVRARLFDPGHNLSIRNLWSCYPIFSVKYGISIQYVA